MITQFNVLATWLKAHTKSERGAAMVEYALLATLISMLVMLSVEFVGTNVSTTFSVVADAIYGQDPGSGGGGSS